MTHIKNSKTTGKNSVKNLRICVTLDDDVDKKLRLLQAKFIQSRQESVSYSRIINLALRNPLDKL